MKFSEGDIVILKHTGEEAVVTGYINDEMLEVTSGDASFPVYADEVEHPYLKWFTEKKNQKKKKSEPEQLPVEKNDIPPQRLAKGIYLSFMPVYEEQEMESIIAALKIFLINELPAGIHYRYEVRINEHVIFSHEGMLPAFAHVYLHYIPFEQINDKPSFEWKIADTDHSKGLKEDAGSLRFKPAKFFAQITALQIKNEAMFSYLLMEHFNAAEKIKQEPPKEIKQTTISFKKEQQKFSLQDIPRFEIDLHIEKILERVKGLSNAELLQIQLDYLKKYLRLAIAHKMDKVIVIHGLGTGALRSAVHQVLKEMPEVGNFVHEWHGSYGFGATQVYFKYW